MEISDFTFNLPKDLIAQCPCQERGKSRLMVLHKNNEIEHKFFEDIIDFLEPGDLILLNDTKVIPVKLTGKDRNGHSLDILITKEIDKNKYQILSRGKFTGKIKISSELEADITDGEKAVFHYEGDFGNLLRKVGKMPLPPYIKRKPESCDKSRYQTVFAKKEGSIAAPTAGLHFTENILNNLKIKGIIIKTITLHIGVGTFKPIKVKHIELHRMEEEPFEVHRSVIDTIHEVKEIGKKVFLVGTTTTRAIEAYMSGNYSLLCTQNGNLHANTDMFIYPGYIFKAVDALLTNFHLPCSTPLMLTLAFAGCERLFYAYKEAVRKGYRFYSYGDAMLIL